MTGKPSFGALAFDLSGGSLDFDAWGFGEFARLARRRDPLWGVARDWPHIADAWRGEIEELVVEDGARRADEAALMSFAALIEAAEEMVRDETGRAWRYDAEREDLDDDDLGGPMERDEDGAWTPEDLLQAIGRAARAADRRRARMQGKRGRTR